MEQNDDVNAAVFPSSSNDPEQTTAQSDQLKGAKEDVASTDQPNGNEEVDEEQETDDRASTSCSDVQEVKQEKDKPTKKVSIALVEDESTDEEDTGDPELKTFRETFSLFDPEKTGVIPRDRIQSCLRSVCATLTEEQIEEIIDQVAGDDEDAINFETFMEIIKYAQSVADREEEILEAFRAFDPEGKGYISTEDLSLILMAIDTAISNNEAQQLIHTLVTRDGRFYYEPFVATLKEMGLLDEL